MQQEIYMKMIVVIHSRDSEESHKRKKKSAKGMSDEKEIVESGKNSIM